MRSTLQKLQQKHQDEGGFTLIELLVVIVIIGILAGVVVFAVSGITDRGEDSACDATAKTIEVAVEAYRAQQGSYASDLTKLDPGFIRFANAKGTLSANKKVFTMQAGGGTISYDSTTGAVTDTC